MGASIAGHLVLQGARVALFDRSDFDRKKGYDIMRADMKNLEQRGLLLPADKDAALGRITLVESHAECVRANLIVEAIFEDLEAKRVLFKELDAAAVKEGTDPILSTNSINFSIGSIVKKGATGSSRKVCGVRFLYPVFFMRPIEISAHEPFGKERETPAIARAYSLLLRFGMEPFYVSLPKPTSDGLESTCAYRRRLNPPEVTRYEEEQCRVARTRADEIARAGGSVSRPVTGGGTESSTGLVVECIICMETRDNVVFAPCGHRNVCMECGTKVYETGRPCPTCRQQIERMLRADTDELMPQVHT